MRSFSSSGTRGGTLSARAGRVYRETVVMRTPSPRGEAQSRSGRPRLQLGHKVVLAVGGLVALLAVSFAVAVLLVLQLRDTQSQLQDRSVPYTAAISSAALSAKGIANDERGYLLTGREEFRRQLADRVAGARAAFAEARRAAAGSEQLAAATDARAGFERWVRGLDAVFAAHDAGNRRGSTQAAFGPVRTLRKDYERALGRAEQLGQAAISSGRASVASASSRTITILLVCLLASLAAGFAVALWLTRAVLRPVESLLSVFADAAGLPDAPVPLPPAEPTAAND